MISITRWSDMGEIQEMARIPQFFTTPTVKLLSGVAKRT